MSVPFRFSRKRCSREVARVLAASQLGGVRFSPLSMRLSDLPLTIPSFFLSSGMIVCLCLDVERKLCV